MNSIEQIQAMLLKADDTTKQIIVRLVKLAPRVHAHSLNIGFDDRTNAFYLYETATRHITAPPPMTLSAVESWLDRCHA